MQAQLNAFQTQHIRWKWATSFILHNHRKSGPLPVTHWIQGWVGPSAHVDTLEKRNISVSWIKPWLSHSPFTIMTELPQLPETPVHCFYNTTVCVLVALGPHNIGPRSVVWKHTSEKYVISSGSCFIKRRTHWLQTMMEIKNESLERGTQHHTHLEIPYEIL